MTLEINNKCILSLHPYLLGILQPYRIFLENIWIETHKEWNNSIVPVPASFHMCRYTCLFLQYILNKEHNIKTDITSGRPSEEHNGTTKGQYGYRDANHHIHDHSWLLYNDTIIIDITADQFGDQAIVITPINDDRYRASPNQDAFKSDFMTLQKRVQRWITHYDLNHGKIR